MMDYKQADLAAMMLRQQGLERPSPKAAQVEFEGSGRGKWSGMVFHIRPQNLLSPLPTTTEAQENPEDLWLTDPFTAPRAPLALIGQGHCGGSANRAQPLLRCGTR
jgi:hypothetical protein